MGRVIEVTQELERFTANCSDALAIRVSKDGRRTDFQSVYCCLDRRTGSPSYPKDQVAARYEIYATPNTQPHWPVHSPANVVRPSPVAR